MGIAHNRALDRDPSSLAGMGVARRWHDPILSLPVAAGVPCLCNSSVDATKVFKMDEAPRLFNRGRRYGVSMKVCSTQVACKLTGSKVRTESSKRRSIEGQLETQFTSAPFGKHSRQQHN